MPKIQILPTLNCQAACSYCFGPHMASKVMPDDIVRITAEWIGRLAERAEYGQADKRVNIIFHGGEPLLAGHVFYRKALPVFERYAGRPVLFSVISNLWAMDREYAQMFKAHNVALAVSLDGPEDINDRQRGEGYFRRAMEGLRLVREAGIPVSAICTFTSMSAPNVDEIFDFFLEQKLDFLVKTVVEPFETKAGTARTLSCEEHIRLINSLMKRFFEHAGQIRVKSLERLIRSIATRSGALYISGNCHGNQLAVDPEGDIYNCQRFAGIKKFKIASVKQQLLMEQLLSAPDYRIFSERMEQVGRECSGCPYFDICAGGCAYNAFAGQMRNNTGNLKDPECKAYEGILDSIVGMIGSIMAGGMESGQSTCLQKKVLNMLLRGIPLSLLSRDGA